MIKKGELTTQQIVALIILITSFAIILFLLVRLNLGETSTKELCRNSVVARGSSILTKGTFPLNCRTNYLCITEDGTCKQMTNPNIKRVSSKEETYEVLAKEMVDCWWMFGEGKINYVEKELLSNLYCSICTQFVLDSSLKKIFEEGELDKRDFYSYLEAKELSKDLTYLNYFYGTRILSEVFQGDFGKLKIENSYYIIMGISNDIALLKYLVGGVVLGFISAGPIGAIIGGVGGIVGGAIVSVAGGATSPQLLSIYVKGESGSDYLSPSIIEVNTEEFKALGYKDSKTLA